MKIKHCITAFAIAFCLTSCEKHEGELYLKSKCTAELNGKTYIDQTRIEQTFNPFAPTATPYIEYNPETTGGWFETDLGPDRDAPAEYFIKIFIPKDLLKGEHLTSTAGRSMFESDLDYKVYCQNNGIAYATIGGELVDNGTFEITSYDLDNGWAYGRFSLPFSEGTITGQFYCGI